MTYPTSPPTAFDYVTFQAGNPTDPLPATDVAGDFANHKTSIDALINFSKLVQRSDGNLQNGSVRPETLSSGTLSLLPVGVVFKGAWVTATAYVPNNIVSQSGNNYICLVGHTSGTFATDLAAGDWQLIDAGKATLSADQTFTGANTFSGVTTLNGATTFGTTMAVTGAATFASTVGVSGILTMTGKAINEAQGANIVSATTTAIGTATGNYVKVTGTTTITAFDTIQAGVRRVVEFTGALLLTHNSTSLILPNAANITTIAGDCAEFISEGSGNWRCTNYTRAAALGATVYLGGDVALNNTSNFFAGPTTGALPPGAYLLTAKSVLTDSGAAALFTTQIHNGTAAIDTGASHLGAAAQIVTNTLSVFVTITAATTFTLQAKDGTNTTGSLLRSNSTATTANLATNISWVRLG